MQLKTFRARSMAQALAEVKKDLGKDAVILHTRAYRIGAVMGMGGHDEYEITAADTVPPSGFASSLGHGSSPAHASTSSSTDGLILTARGPTIRERASRDHPSREQNSRSEFRDSSSNSVRALVTPVGSVAPTGAEDFVPASYSSLGLGDASVSRQHFEAPASPSSHAAFTEIKPSQPIAQPNTKSPSLAIPQPRTSLTTPATFAPADDQALGQLKDELGSIRRLVGQLLSETRRSSVQGLGTSGPAWGSLASSPLAQVSLGEPLLDQSLRLQEAGVRSELIDRIIGGVRDELSPDELADAQIVATSVQRHVASLLPVVGSVARAGNRPHPQTGVSRPRPRPLVIALIGPTGVGKTTTIAKLAATYALKHGAKVGLITCDTYRIAAVDQLRTYAGILDMPMKVALTPREAIEAAESLADTLADRGVILVDSAGRSPQDSVRLDEMGAFLEALAPEQTHLVLSAGAAEDALTLAATRFGILQPTHLLLTKLDEAVRYGVLLNLAHAVGLKINYVTTGQEVPAQIELANADRLARLVLEGKLRQ